MSTPTANENLLEKTSFSGDSNATGRYNELVGGSVSFQPNTIADILKKRVISNGSNHIFNNASNANNGFNTVLTFVSVELIRAAIEQTTFQLDGANDTTIAKLVGKFDTLEAENGITGTLQTASQPNITSVGTLSSVDINGGAIDGTTIGANSAAAGTFTTLTANTSISGTLSTASQPNITSVGTLSSVDINGGAIDGTTIGANVAAAGSFTTISASGNVTIGGNLTVSGTTTTVNSTTVEIGDSIITLNSGATGTPTNTQHGGIEIERGDSDNVRFIWDETNDRWVSQIYDTNANDWTLANLAGNFSGSVTISGVDRSTTSQPGANPTDIVAALNDIYAKFYVIDDYLKAVAANINVTDSSNQTVTYGTIDLSTT
jgi:hypothetical protein